MDKYIKHHISPLQYSKKIEQIMKCSYFLIYYIFSIGLFSILHKGFFVWSGCEIYTHICLQAHRRMEGCQMLGLYFSHNNSQSLQMLTNRASLKCMLEDTSLVLLLRYLENLHLYDLETYFKVLLLLSRLVKINPSKICNLIPFPTITFPQFNKSQMDECDAFVLQKIINYANYLIRRPSNDHFAQELEVLTKNLLKIYHLIQYTNIRIIRYAKVFYWIVQQTLYEYWQKVNKDLPNIDRLDQEGMEIFYENYCNFWKYKRKIPKIMHRNLKSTEVSSQKNQEIESRFKQICCQQNTEPKKFFSSSKLETMILLMDQEFQDD